MTVDFGFGITHGVETFDCTFESAIWCGTAAPWLAEIDVTGQFTDYQQVQTGNDFRLEGGCACQFWIEDGWTQVGEQFQVLAQSQDSLFWTQ